MNYRFPIIISKKKTLLSSTKEMMEKKTENNDEAELFHAFVGRHAPRHLAYQDGCDANGSARGREGELSLKNGYNTCLDLRLINTAR